MNFYFAYGSMLLGCKIKQIVPDILNASEGVLKHHRLAFRGQSERIEGSVATIVEDLNHDVNGFVYFIGDHSDISSLDKWEGYPKHYSKKKVKIEIAGGILECFTYVKNSNEIGTPSVEYFLSVAKGYREKNLNLKPLIEAYIESLGEKR